MKKVIVGILALIICFSVFGCNSDDTSEDGNIEENVKVEYSGNLDYYYNLLQEMDDPEKELKDKLLEVTGEYTEEFGDLYYIGDSTGDIYCCVSFDEETADIEALKKGKIITVTGRCIDASDDSIQLTDAVLDKVADKKEGTSKSDSENKPEAKPEKESNKNVESEPASQSEKEPETVPTCSVCGAIDHTSHPTCSVCGAIDHTSHPTCATCGSTEHVTHPEEYQGNSGNSGNSVTIPEAESGGNLVWIPVNGGTKYHCRSGCSNMNGPIQVSVETAMANGFTACGRCY